MSKARAERRAPVPKKQNPKDPGRAGVAADGREGGEGWGAGRMLT